MPTEAIGPGIVLLEDDGPRRAEIESLRPWGGVPIEGPQGRALVPKRSFAPILLAVIVVGCGQNAATDQPASPAASDVAAVPSSAPSERPSAAPEATPTPTPEPSPTPSPTPTPTPEPWQKYSSKKFKYSIKYPPDWVVTPSTPGYSDMFDDRASTFVFVDRDVVDAGSVAALERTVKAQKAYFKSHFDAKVVSDRKVNVAGWKGRLVKMTGYNEGLETYFQLLMLTKGRVGYFLEMQTVDDSRDEDKTLFERIYKTFKPRS